MSVGGVNQIENEPKRRASKKEVDDVEAGGGSYTGIAPIEVNNTDHEIRCNTDASLQVSDNPVRNTAVFNAINDTNTRIANVDARLGSKQDLLVSGTNIKTINGNSVLGSGDLEVGGGITVDEELSSISENPVQNKQITAWLLGHALDRAQGTAASQDVEGYVNIGSLSVGSMGNQLIVNDTAGCTVPNTTKGTTGLKAVNCDRLMDEVNDCVKKSSDSLQKVDSYLEVSKGSNRYIKTWGGSTPNLELGDMNTPVAVPNSNTGSQGTAAVNSTRLMQEIAAIPKDSTPTAGSNNVVTSGGVKTALDSKQATMSANSPMRITADVITIDMDAAPTSGSGKPVTSNGLKTRFDAVASDLTTLGNAINTTDDKFGGLKIIGYWHGKGSQDSVTKWSGNLNVQAYGSSNPGLYLLTGFNVNWQKRIIFMQIYHGDMLLVKPAKTESNTQCQFTVNTPTGSAYGSEVWLDIIMYQTP